MDEAFEAQKRDEIERMAGREDLTDLSTRWIKDVSELGYTYHFSWMGLPIIQLPQDMVAMQELVWSIRPDLVIETGIARGGSLVFYASLLQLLGNAGRVLGIDIDIRTPNRAALDAHPMRKHIDLIEGSSTSDAVIEQVAAAAAKAERVLVVLDSNHTHEHVLAELKRYAPFVTSGSYLVVFDTIIEDLPEDYFPDRPWGPGNNPRTAVQAFIEGNDDFEVDTLMDAKLQVTVARGGYLRRR